MTVLDRAAQQFARKDTALIEAVACDFVFTRGHRTLTLSCHVDSDLDGFV
jgi:hypothetical protein